MRKKAVTQFCRRVGKELRCYAKTKRALIKGLEDELSELPNEDNCSLRALEAKVGTPSQVAEELQESIPMEEENDAIRMNRMKKVQIIGGILGLSLILLLLAIFIFLNGPFYVVETIQEG